MQLLQAVSTAIKTNTSLPITTIISDIDLRIECFSTYNKIVQKYHPRLKQCFLQQPQFLNQKIILIQVSMTPEDMHWMIWKNYQEISQFLTQIEKEIELMMKTKQLQLDKNGMFNEASAKQISLEFYILKQQFKRDFTSFNEQNAQRFVVFMNKLGEQTYLRKTIPFLIFISHCISIDKWNVMIHYQTYIYKDPVCISNKILGFFKSVEPRKEVDYFVTIVGDGILISDDHLLLSKVRKMIPFTNQMKINCNMIDQNLVYEISSGRIQSIKLNFYRDYSKGINFGCGLGRALRYSGYKFLMGINDNPTFSGPEFGYSQNYVAQKTLMGQNRFYSYAQQRDLCNAKLYHDGCGYFEDLYNELMKAEKQVCITGWMITPYFMLKRPGSIHDTRYRLDYVLEELAERGVKIFIICFMQPALLVNNDSQHVQQHLEGLHKNIKVYRHPNVAVPQLWSHHQKMVVIDQKIGFMGGLDICYGRWDTHEHKLVEQKEDGYWDGQEFNNYRLKDIYTPRIFYKTNLNKDFQPRMPWHDIAVQIRGDVVIDLLRHFVQYWFFVKSQLSTDPRVLFNLIQKRLNQTNEYQKVEKQYLLSKLSKDTQDTFAQKFNSFKQQMEVVVKGAQARSSQLFIEQRQGMNEGNLRIQMLRSASEWSIGLQVGKFQCSIHNAYIDLIENSESFIYIQNQFFMGLENKIVQKLADRILKARYQKKPFKVVVVMPLLPGFEGYIADPAATVLRIQMHWQYEAISRGKNSLFKRLINGGIPEAQISNYIYFFGLRKGDVLNSIPVTQIIYVHSKLMIVDDKRVIVGSANINDRSLLGNRDSQIAICIEDDDKKQTHHFRRKVFEEHFGFDSQDSVNYLDEKVWHQLITRAVRNTQIFRNVFACLPDDLVSKIIDIDTFQEKHGDITSWFNQSKNIKGHVVTFPLDFLCKQDLTFKLSQVQYFAPDHTFT